MTIHCVEVLLKQKNVDFQIVVVENDNNSQNLSIFRMHFSDYSNVHIISTRNNIGYARGNNFGFEWCNENNFSSDYTAIINNDIEIYDENLLEYLVGEYNSKTDMGIISPSIIQNKTRKFQGPYRERHITQYIIETIFPLIIPIRKYVEQKKIKSIKDTIAVYRTMGSFMLINTQLFMQIGLFDPNTFLGSEEDILSYKLAKINKKFYYSPKYFVIHENGKSSSHLISTDLCKYYMDSTIYFWEKYKNAKKIKLFILKSSIYARNYYLKILNTI